MSGPYQGRDLSNCSIGRICVAINCGILNVNILLCAIYHHKINYLIGREKVASCTSVIEIMV